MVVATKWWSKMKTKVTYYKIENVVTKNEVGKFGNFYFTL